MSAPFAGPAGVTLEASSRTPLLSIVVPTVTGREASLQRTLAAYRRTSSRWELVVVRDRPNWPTACNQGYLVTSGAYVHFGADDLVPTEPGWWHEAVGLIEARGELPAARVLEHGNRPSGSPEWYDDGPDGEPATFSRVPLLSRSQYERIGAWPQIDYYADCWLSARARELGIETRNVWAYSFDHYWHQVGRISDPDRLAHARREYERLVGK